MQRAADGGESQSTGLVEAAGASSPGGTGLPAQDEWSTCSQLPGRLSGAQAALCRMGALTAKLSGGPPYPTPGMSELNHSLGVWERIRW